MARASGRARKTAAPADAAPDVSGVTAWSLEPHVCRCCFSRLLSAPGPGGSRLYHCPNCGAAAQGSGPEVLCSCGLTIRRPGRNGLGQQHVSAGVRCAPNPSPSPEFPSLFVAVGGNN